jgi:hypothetical protein
MMMLLFIADDELALLDELDPGCCTGCPLAANPA